MKKTKQAFAVALMPLFALASQASFAMARSHTPVFNYNCSGVFMDMKTGERVQLDPSVRYTEFGWPKGGVTDSVTVMAKTKNAQLYWSTGFFPGQEVHAGPAEEHVVPFSETGPWPFDVTWTHEITYSGASGTPNTEMGFRASNAVISANIACDLIVEQATR